MKNKSRKIVFAAVAIIALNVTACQQVSSSTKEETYSTTPVYYCDRASDGTPTTFGATPSGIPLALIRWESNFFTGAGYTPERRCEEVSANFEKYRLEDRLKFITTGKENGERVICVSSEYGGRCQGTLWTLKKDDDASELLHQLFQVGHLSRTPLDQSSKDASSQVYIDIDEILRKAAEKQ